MIDGSTIVRSVDVTAPPAAGKALGFAVRDPWGYEWDFWQKGKPFQDGTGGLREVRAKQD